MNLGLRTDVSEPFFIFGVTVCCHFPYEGLLTKSLQQTNLQHFMTVTKKTPENTKKHGKQQSHVKFYPSPQPVGCTDDFVWTTPEMQGKVWKARHFVWQDLLLFRRDFSSPNRAFYAAAKVELQPNWMLHGVWLHVVYVYFGLCVMTVLLDTCVCVYACVCLTVAHLDCRKKAVKMIHMSVCRLGCSKRSRACSQVHRVRYSSFI